MLSRSLRTWTVGDGLCKMRASINNSTMEVHVVFSEASSSLEGGKSATESTIAVDGVCRYFIGHR